MGLGTGTGTGTCGGFFGTRQAFIIFLILILLLLGIWAEYVPECSNLPVTAGLAGASAHRPL